MDNKYFKIPICVIQKVNKRTLTFKAVILMEQNAERMISKRKHI